MFRKGTEARDDYTDYFDETAGPAENIRDRRPRHKSRRTRGSTAEDAPDSTARHPFALACLAFGVIAIAAALLAVRLVAGPAMLEKTVKALMAPVGIVWLLLTALVWMALLRRQALLACAASLAWLVLTVGGNSLFVDWLGDSLQRPWAGFDVDSAPPVDTLLVLGGGTATTPSGNAQGGGAADRVLVAARIAMAGSVQRIVCAGSHPVPMGAERPTAAGEMRELLIALGVPGDRIEVIGGRNTREEMQEFARWRERQENGDAATVGIVTSAWHMRRALRLAEAAGIEAEPLPGDFRNADPRATPHILVPGADLLEQCQAYLAEYLAGLAGR
jgi:uncharacterized SAM-binding protein YcdF (DUF218 family)